MTPKKLKKILSEYQALLRPGERMPEEGCSVRVSIDRWRRTLVEGHLHWMCKEAQTFLKDSICGCGQNHGPDPKKVEKAMRWLGFIQGCLWCMEFKSINDLRNDSKPDEEEFLTPEQKKALEKAADAIVTDHEDFLKLIRGDGARTSRFDSTKENRNSKGREKG